jgi:hypothetical protein
MSTFGASEIVLLLRRTAYLEPYMKEWLSRHVWPWYPPALFLRLLLGLLRVFFELSNAPFFIFVDSF